jgi:hypothetical protein
MFQNENGYDEAGNWLAKDENGKAVGEGEIKNDPDNLSSADYTNNNTGSMSNCR